MANPTASSVFLRTLASSGVTHAFVNWGSDHPALLADLDRQRSLSSSGTDSQPTIVTCPNEMVALSAAQGYAQVTGKPALVIVHVDVGTQALAGAVHNVDRNRVPVIIYAGASPFSTEGEHKGSRNEWIMWVQDVPDQPSVVRQYMRYTSQLNSAPTIPGVVRRAVQIASSEPKGPVYLWARREVMEEELDPVRFKEITASIAQQTWPTIDPTALSSTAASRIASALLTAKHPIIITSHLGRNPHAVTPLLALSTLLALPVLPVCPSVVSVPHSHPFGLAPSFLTPVTPTSGEEGVEVAKDISYLSKADVILVIDCDLAWIPGNGQGPSPGARVFVLDGGDPLKTTVQMGWWNGDAELICRADALVALGQILAAIQKLDPGGAIANSDAVKARAFALKQNWERRITEMDIRELDYTSSRGRASNGDQGFDNTIYTVPNVLRSLREAIQNITPSRGARTLVLNETITNFPIVWEHMRPEVPGNMISSGGSSLGWSLAAAVGSSMGGIVVASAGHPTSHGSTTEPSTASTGDEMGANQEDGNPASKFDLVVAIVGDGSFLFCVPSSVYWMARRYNTPFLTIVLNNGGWKAPKLSMLAVHSVGVNGQPLSSVSGDALTTGFGPICPDYSQIAVAASAGWAWGTRVGGAAGEGDIDPSEASPDAAVDHGKRAKLELDRVMTEAVKKVVEERRCAVLDCVLEGI